MKPGTKDDSGAVLLCEHVAKEGKPILRGRRDQPQSPEDSGWQFRCNVASEEDIKKVQIWSVREVLETDPTLRAIITQPYGTVVERIRPDADWNIASVEAADAG